MSRKVIRATRLNGQLQVIDPKSITKDISSLENIGVANNLIYRELSRLDAVSMEKRLTAEDTYVLKDLVGCIHVLSKLEKDIIKNLNLEEMTDEEFLATAKRIIKKE